MAHPISRFQLSTLGCIYMISSIFDYEHRLSLISTKHFKIKITFIYYPQFQTSAVKIIQKYCLETLYNSKCDKANNVSVVIHLTICFYKNEGRLNCKLSGPRYVET